MKLSIDRKKLISLVFFLVLSSSISSASEYLEGKCARQAAFEALYTWAPKIDVESIISTSREIESGNATYKVTQAVMINNIAPDYNAQVIWQKFEITFLNLESCKNAIVKETFRRQ